MPDRAPRSGLPYALAAAALVVAISVYGAARLKPQGGYDGAAFVRYAQVLKQTGGLPTPAQTYEYASPPAYIWETVQLQRLGDAIGGPGSVALGGAALLLAAGGLAAGRRGRRRWAAAALGGAGLCAALALVGVAARSEWRLGQLLSAGFAGGLVLAGYLLGREVWPDRRLAPAGVAALTAAIPIVIRLGTMLHPESQFAFLAALALWLALRGRRRGWPWTDGVALGAVLGLAALTRQTAVVVALSLAVFVAVAGRRRAIPFGAAALVVLVLVAGPWWGWQAHVYGNPLQSNLDRFIIPGGQPRSFYVSAPLRTLILHPYRPDFAGQLWPQFHADLWSDWFGGQHGYWGSKPSAATRVFLSSQSLLGLLATPLALGGLLVFGGRGLARLLRARAGQPDAAFAACFVVTVLTWAAFVAQLVRFPQSGGDPIKASYMLFLSPVFALFGLAAGRALWRRGRGWRFALGAWTALYAVSYAGFLLTSW